MNSAPLTQQFSLVGLRLFGVFSGLFGWQRFFYVLGKSDSISQTKSIVRTSWLPYSGDLSVSRRTSACLRLRCYTCARPINENLSLLLMAACAAVTVQHALSEQPGSFGSAIVCAVAGCSPRAPCNDQAVALKCSTILFATLLLAIFCWQYG